MTYANTAQTIALATTNRAKIALGTTLTLIRIGTEDRRFVLLLLGCVWPLQRRGDALGSTAVVCDWYPTICGILVSTHCQRIPDLCDVRSIVSEVARFWRQTVR